MLSPTLATQVIESLRKGLPPQRGVDLYSVGNEKLLDGIKKFHLSGIGDRGIIRFISGSWGSGKTHFFRVLREVAFRENCLVSNVELDVNNAALNKFERVFAAIVSQVVTPTHFNTDASQEAMPFGKVVSEALQRLGSSSNGGPEEVTHEVYGKASERLMKDTAIDIDFRKMIQKYWETWLPEQTDVTLAEQTRGEVLQWFRGEGTLSAYRKRFGVAKMVSRENAKLMLQSLAGFVRLAGYRGLLILFDEAEQAYSVMKKSSLRDAQNNLLSLINNIETLQGLFLIYATTPDFYTDPKHGIVTYGALSGRIGKPEQKPPRALDTIWNMDEVKPQLEQYQEAAAKIAEIYAVAYPSVGDTISADAVKAKVEELDRIHPSLASVAFWRIMVAGLVSFCDDVLDGEPRPTQQLYDDVMDRLRND